MRKDHETLTRIWLGNEAEKFGTKWEMRLQDWVVTPGFVTCSRSCLVAQKGEVKIDSKMERQKLFWPGGPWNESTQLLTERLNPFFSQLQELRTALGKRRVSAVPGFQQNQQHSSPDFKGNWIRPMSRAFQRLILKSFVLVTLPEGKQTVRSGCPCRHSSLQLKGLNLDEPHKWFYPLNKPNLAQFLILSKFRVWEEPGSREIPSREAAQGEQHPRELGKGPCSPFRVQAPAPCLPWRGHPWDKKSYREKSFKSQSLFGRYAAI